MSVNRSALGELVARVIFGIVIAVIAILILSLLWK